MRKCCSEGRFSDCSQEAPKEPKETWLYLFARNRWLPGSRDNCEMRFRLEMESSAEVWSYLIPRNSRLPWSLGNCEVRFRLETGSSTEVWPCYLLETGGSQGAWRIVSCSSG